MVLIRRPPGPLTAALLPFLSRALELDPVAVMSSVHFLLHHCESPRTPSASFHGPTTQSPCAAASDAPGIPAVRPPRPPMSA